MRHLSAFLVGVVVLLLAPRSRAGSVEIVTTGGTPWAQLVEQIQEEVGSQGRVYSLVVRDGGVLVPCDEYRLSLDTVAAAAFRVGDCDGATSATTLRLVYRPALFEEGDVVPRARRASVSATILRRGSADGGGAPAPAGSKIWCSVALQPYLFDRLRGQPVPLMPDRFVLRPIEAHIQAAPDGAGWIARGESRFALRFHYEVIDVHTGSKVLENEASLVCADGPVGASGTGTGVPAEALRPPEKSPVSRPAVAPAVRKPPESVTSLDFLPLLGMDVVATLLVRPLADVVFGDGTRASKMYGRAPVAVWGGSTMGFTYQRGPLFVPIRYTMAGDAHVLAQSAFAGIGGAWSPDADTTVYAAAAPRFTWLIQFDSGFFNRFDGAALIGFRRRLWLDRCHGGFEAFIEAAAPLASAGVWFASAGLTQSWGPGGGYWMSGCPWKAKGRR